MSNLRVASTAQGKADFIWFYVVMGVDRHAFHEAHNILAAIYLIKKIRKFNKNWRLK